MLALFLSVISSPFALGASSTNSIVLRSPEEREFAYYGSSLLGLSDLTGDGIGELAVGAFGHGDGAVFILDGTDFSLVREINSPNPNAEPDSGSFGGSLADAPDSTGDGIPELVVGAIYADRPDLQNAGFGQAYMIDPTSGAEIITLHAPRPHRNTQFGWEVAALPSSIAGQPTHIAVSAPAGSIGRVYYFDANTGDMLASITAPTARTGDWFGSSLAAIADIDGDDRMDLAVGAGNQNGPQAGAGAAYLISGETGKLLYQLFPPDLGSTRHRWVVSRLPDSNGDGKPDVLVGIALASLAGAPASAGSAYAFNGVDGKWLRTYTSPAPEKLGYFGWDAAGLPDITGDGCGEVLISATGRPAIGSLGEQRMHLLNGATGEGIQSFESPHPGQGFAACVTGILDKKGRLRTVVAGSGVAAPEPAPTRAGRAYAFPLSLSFLSLKKTGSELLLSLSSLGEDVHDLEVSSDLLTWTPLSTLKHDSQSSTLVDIADGQAARFYRSRRSVP